MSGGPSTFFLCCLEPLAYLSLSRDPKFHCRHWGCCLCGSVDLELGAVCEREQEIGKSWLSPSRGISCPISRRNPQYRHSQHISRNNPPPAPEL